MTVYWILIQNGLKPESTERIIIHLVGVNEIELEYNLRDFEELKVLFPRCCITFICIGPGIPDEFKHRTYKSKQRDGRGVSFEFYKMLYLRQTVERQINAEYQRPNIIIGLNSGFGSYQESWSRTLQYIFELKVPAFFTEFQLSSVITYSRTLIHYNGCELGDIQPNPFVEPLVTLEAPGRILSLYNNWIYAVNPKGINISKLRHNPLQYRYSEKLERLLSSKRYYLESM